MAKIQMYGIDISNHQGVENMDLDAVLTNHPECKVVIIKVSDGTGFTDIYADKFIKIALAHGCLVAVYHYGRPSRNGYLAEAKFFWSLAKKWLGKVLFVLDWEDKGGASKVTWAKNFLNYIKNKSGTTPIFYSYESMINANNYSDLSGFPLWVAKYRDYTVDKNWDMSYAGTAPRAKWWDSYIAWQWTSSGRLDGYSGNLDCNAFYIDEDTWMSYFNGTQTETAEEKTNTVDYKFDVTNPVKISNSGSDENGRYRGGKAGDQTGREWYIRSWYNRPWNCVLRHPDANVRANIAHLSVLAAQNDKIGYDQNQRDTFWTQLKLAKYDPSKIDTACESDCSAGVIAITKAVGYILGDAKLQDVGATYTGNMRSAYLNAGFMCLTASKYTENDDYLLAGDILLNDAHHVCTAVTNGVKSGEETSDAEETCTMPLLKKGSQGKAVKFLQTVIGRLEIDGSFGDLTRNAVIKWQKSHGCTDDGEVWCETWNAMIPTLPMLKRGSRGRYVKALQIALGIADDSSFGWDTTNAVVDFQTESCIEVDGIVGQETWREIIKSL